MIASNLYQIKNATVDVFFLHTNVTISDFDSNSFKNLPAPAWLKISATVSYLLQVGGSLILITFDYLERKGVFGKHRSVINSINAWIHAYAALFCSITVGIDLSRITLGPLPVMLCKWNAVIKNTLMLSLVSLNVATVFLKFMFICIWKSFRHMNHKCISYFVGMASLLVSFLLSIIQEFGPGRTSMFINICTATFYESEQLNKVKINAPGGATYIGLAIYLGLCIPIAIKRLQAQKKDYLYHQQSLNMVGLMFNLAYMVIFASNGFAIIDLNEHSNARELDITEVWMHLPYIYFITPVTFLTLAILRTIVKHNQLRKTMSKF
jgi:preprotein translocase subunit Sec61beta